MLTMLIVINLVVFAILAFIKVIYYFGTGDSGVAAFNSDIFQWLTLPADTGRLISRPWTIFTHMFVHDTSSIWHIVGNMLWLWVFGYILQDLAGNRKIFPIYFYGALAGAAAFILAYNFIPALKVYQLAAHAFGASAGVMGIAIATTVLAPGYRIFPMLNGGIPLWVITVLYLIIDLATIPYNNAGGHIAHIAGGAMGFAFMLALQRGRDWGAWMNNLFDWVNDLWNPEKPQRQRSTKDQLFYKATVKPFSKANSITQQRVDEILDKISQKGMGSLTDDEKEVLKRAAENDML